MHGGNLHYAVRLKPRKIPQRIWVKKKNQNLIPTRKKKWLRKNPEE